MSRILVALFAVLALTGAAGATDDGWITFHDPAGAFSIDMPVQPTVKPSGSDSSVHRIDYIVEIGDQWPMMVRDTDVTRARATLSTDALASGMEKQGYTILSDEQTTLDGHDGVKLVTRAPSGKTEITSLIFLFNAHLYQAAAAVAPDATPQQIADAQHFLASFHFTN